ncbi:MAG: regulatory protein RecX [Vicinamibacterales bacterium]
MADRRSAYLDALHLLARRELSVSEVRERLVDKEHPPDEIEAAIEHLIETGGLDDARVARAYARTAVNIKGRGRLRVQRELNDKGISRDVAAAALADVFGDADERSMVAKAIQKRLRGRTTVKDRAESVRLYQHLMRQGYTPATVMAALRKLSRGSVADDE